MSKFLLIGSIAAVLYGDCAWGMDDIDPWKSASASSQPQLENGAERDSANAEVRSRRNSRQFNAESTRENAGVSYQDAQTQTERARQNSKQTEENRFIKIGFESGWINGSASGDTGAVLNNTYLQHYYAISNNSKMGYATPTTVVTVTGDNLRGWNDIAEIRYANDVSYDKLENPKVILYRNRDNSCYIILRIGDNKHGVFYGTNERNIEVGRSSFAVYDLSEDVGSFTDSVARLIYVDESGLYFVPKAENSVEKVIDSYQKEGKFKFEGSVVKVSAVDGTITLNGEPITKENFFDNWVLEERETEKQVNTGAGGFKFGATNTNTGFNFGATGFGANTTVPTFSGFGASNTSVKTTVLSTKQPGEKEILRNFYPPEGRYVRIHGANYEYATDTTPGGHQIHTALNWLNAYGIPNKIGTSSWGRQSIIDLRDRNWFSTFISNRIRLAKARSKNGAEELVKNGTFSSILSTYTDRRYDHDSYLDNANGYPQKVRDAIADRVAAKRGQTMSSVKARFSDKRVDQPSSISDLVLKNSDLFKDPEFVKSLKPAFAEIEKGYEHNKESEMWIPFEIVKNL